MKRRLLKNLSPKARKLTFSSNKEKKVLMRLEYKSERIRKQLEEALANLGVQIRSIQGETRSMSLLATTGVIEDIAQIPGVVYIEAQSYYRE